MCIMSAHHDAWSAARSGRATTQSVSSCSSDFTARSLKTAHDERTRRERALATLRRSIHLLFSTRADTDTNTDTDTDTGPPDRDMAYERQVYAAQKILKKGPFAPRRVAARSLTAHMAERAARARRSRRIWSFLPPLDRPQESCIATQMQVDSPPVLD